MICCLEGYSNTHYLTPADMPGMKPVNTRALAARTLARVLGEGQSLTHALTPALAEARTPDQGLLQELCFGTLRWYPQLQFLLDRLLNKPLKSQQREIQALLLLGLYQLQHLRVPEYAAISETVAASRELSKPWALGLINAVLRNFQRRRTALMADIEQDETARCAHPAWLLERLKADWPEDWPTLVTVNNSRSPCGLRVNLQRTSRQAYLHTLNDAGIEATLVPYIDTGIILASACDVERLPGFREGLVSVQDPAAQLAAGVLDLQPGMRVLDACAAPGGKTCHILESEPSVRLLALDIDLKRLARIRENLDRLNLTAQLLAGDALQPESWWDGVPFDRILVDAPCSATGVIRRHPDIKVLRKAADIGSLADRQRALLARLWSLLAPGGMLVYATCSILKQENEGVVADFLADQAEARERPIADAWGRPGLQGRQILPGEAEMDGFYYARLGKYPGN